MAAPTRRDAAPARGPPGDAPGGRLVTAARRRVTGTRLPGRLRAIARAEGRRHTDARVGWRGGRPSRPVRVQQRAGRATAVPRRAGAPRALLKIRIPAF